MGVKCLAQEHNAVPWPGLEPGTSDPESSALTIRPPRHPPFSTLQKHKINPFHGLMLLPKPYGIERKVLVFARVRIKINTM